MNWQARIHTIKMDNERLKFIDIAARLPYGVKCRVSSGADGLIIGIYLDGEVRVSSCYVNTYARELIDVKPYLRPMNSMTEADIGRQYEDGVTIKTYLDWLNAHMFDYRGLIAKGEAIEAPQGMYNFDNE